MDFSEKDFAVGLSYVAVSRVKSIDGIMFKSDFGMARFQARSSSPGDCATWTRRNGPCRLSKNPVAAITYLEVIVEGLYDCTNILRLFICVLVNDCSLWMSM